MKHLALLCVLLVAAAGAPAAFGGPLRVSAEAQRAVQSKGGARVLVMLRDDRESRSRSALPRASQARDRVRELLAALPHGHYQVLRRFATVPAVALRVDGTALARLAVHPLVRRVDPDAGGAVHALAPDEASVLNRVDALGKLGLTGSGMKIALVDTGVDADHADLRSRLVSQQCFCSAAGGSGGCCPNGQATQSGSGAAEDDNGHGTNVAGIMVGEGRLAPRGALPAASLVAVKVVDRDNRFCCSSDIVAALDWLASNHPDVDAVNLSLGTDALFAGDCDADSAYTMAMANAVDRLVALGAVVTVSTGNEGSVQSAAAPACVRNALGTAATWDFSGGALSFLGCTESSTAPRKIACFSNRSPTTDLLAAGAFVTSTGLGGSTSEMGGTSMAAPMAASCAAALKQGAPASTVDQRTEAMRLSTVRVADPLSGRTYPFLDCQDALRLLAPGLFEPIPRNGSRPLPVPKPGKRRPAAGAMVATAERGSNTTARKDIAKARFAKGSRPRK